MIVSVPVHYKLYKPFGMLSQFNSNDAKEARKKRFLGELYDFPENIMPIGRLDEKSEGLLLLTNDGKLSDTINRSGIEKEYYVQLDGAITDSAMTQLQNGVEIGLQGNKYRTKTCKVSKLETPPRLPEADSKLRIGSHGRPTSWICIVITEGKYRQIRKMTAAVGFPTVRLIRIRVGSVSLESMIVGEVVPLVKISL